MEQPLKEIAQEPEVALKEPFFVFDTHPIQYRSPVFAALSKKHPGLQVFYFNKSFNARKWWFNEVGKSLVSEWGEEFQLGFPNKIIGSKKLGLWGFYRKVKALLLKRRPGAMVIYGYYLPEHWMLWWLSRRLQIPLLFVGETFFGKAKGLRGLIKRYLVPLFFNRVRHFITIGKKNLSFYRSLQVEESRLTQAKYCVDVSSFELDSDRSKSARQRIRESLKIPEDVFVLLFVGRLFDRKRPWDMVTIHQLLSRSQDVHTIMVGSGELQRLLREQVKREKKMHLVGFKDQSEIRDFYHAADLLVVPSEFETWGLVVNEAFASRLPALVTNTCGVAGDLVVSGETGYVYPVGKVDVATVIIKYLIEDPNELRLMKAKAHQKVIQQYGVDQFSSALMHAFRQVAY